jgi:hypothetical protein
MVSKTVKETRGEWVQELLKDRAAVEHAIREPIGQMLGCGYFGCAFDSRDPWVVKLTIDPQEGPMWAVIMDILREEGGRGQSGFTRVKEVVRLRPGVGTGKRKKALYAVVREEVQPIFESKPPNSLTDYSVRRLELDPDDKQINPTIIAKQAPDLDRFSADLVDTRGIPAASAERIAAQLRDFWNAMRAMFVYDTAVAKNRKRRLSKKDMAAQIRQALALCKGEVGRGLGDGLAVLLDHGVVLHDLHVLNVGWRIFADIEGWPRLDRGIAVFDPGFTPTPYKPKIGERIVENAPLWAVDDPVFR